MSFLSKIISIFSLFKQSIRGDEQNFTEGSINRALFLLSVPMVLEMSMEALFALADVLFVSMMEDNDAIATIGLRADRRPIAAPRRYERAPGIEGRPPEPAHLQPDAGARRGVAVGAGVWGSR